MFSNMRLERTHFNISKIMLNENTTAGCIHVYTRQENAPVCLCCFAMLMMNHLEVIQNRFS